MTTQRYTHTHSFFRGAWGLPRATSTPCAKRNYALLSSVGFGIFDVASQLGSPWLFGVDGDIPNSFSACDVSYVDDTVFACIADSPQEAYDRTHKALPIIHNSFRGFGVDINYGQGKTEAIVAFRGAQAPAYRKRMFIYDGATTRFVCVDGARECRVVSSYKHVGSHLCASGATSAEICHRTGSASSTRRSIAGRVLCKQGLHIDTRTNAAEAFVFSRLFFNCQLWHGIARSSILKLHNVYIRTVRSVHNFQRFGTCNNVSDADLLANVKLPSVDVRLRGARLLYLVRFFRFAPLTLRLLVASCAELAHTWPQFIVDDLEWLFKRDHRVAEILDPRVHLVSWFIFIQSHPSAWRRIVSSNCRTSACNDPRVEASPGSELGLACDLCSRTFSCRKSLCTHKFRAHNVRSEPRQYVQVPTCPICLKHFHHRWRLIHHLAFGSKKCFGAMINLHYSPLPTDLVHALDKSDAIELRALAKSGKTRWAVTYPAFRVPGPIVQSP